MRNAQNIDDNDKRFSAPTGNRTQGKCLEGTYVTTTPQVLAYIFDLSKFINYMQWFHKKNKALMIFFYFIMA